MGLHLVIGTKTTRSDENPTLLYMGLDGVSALEAAKTAQESGDYIHGRIRRQVIYSWIPCPILPTPRKSDLITTPSGPKPELNMKRNFKRGLSAVAACAALLFSLCLNTNAQSSAGTLVPTYGSSTASLGVASVALGSTSNLTSTAGIIDTRYFQNLGLQLAFNMSAAESPAPVITLTFAQSADGSNFGTVGTKTWAITANGTNTVIAPTNFVVGGLGWFKLQSIQSAATNSTLTNIVLTYSIKRSAP